MTHKKLPFLSNRLNQKHDQNDAIDSQHSSLSLSSDGDSNLPYDDSSQNSLDAVSQHDNQIERISSLVKLRSLSIGEWLKFYI